MLARGYHELQLRSRIPTCYPLWVLISLQCKPWETFTFWNILLGGNSGKLVDVGGVSGAERGEDKSPGWG